MEDIVNRLTENRQIELAKEILESNGYKVTKDSKRLYGSSVIPTEVIDNSLDIEYFSSDNGYSEEEISDYREELEDMAKYLGVSVDRVLVTGDDFEGFDFFMDIVKESNIIQDTKMKYPGCAITVYQAPQGFKFVWKTEFGYNTVFFIR